MLFFLLQKLPAVYCTFPVLQHSRAARFLTAHSDQNHKTRKFFYFLSNETHHDFVEPVSYICMIASSGAVTSQYPIDKQDKIRCLKIMQRWQQIRGNRRRDNIAAVTHCMTRLRFVVKDDARVDSAALKGLSGVLGVVRSDNQCQVIIGNTVSPGYREVVNLLPATCAREPENRR
jgi:phosphotransferase system IIB component